jgi:hypothetical protein
LLSRDGRVAWATPTRECNNYLCFCLKLMLDSSLRVIKAEPENLGLVA